MSQSRNTASPSERTHSDSPKKEVPTQVFDSGRERGDIDLKGFWSGFLSLACFDHEPFLRDSLATLKNQEIRKFYVPESDVYDRDDDYIVTVDLPGVRSQDLRLELRQEFLRIHGHREILSELDSPRARSTSRSHGDFMKEFKLPKNINIDEVSVQFNRGVLSVRLGKN